MNKGLSEKEEDGKEDDGPEDDAPIKTCFQFPQVVLLANAANDDDIITINVFPAIKGEGWPRGAKLQHALPKQMPFGLKGKQFLKGVEDYINDGQSVWFLEAKPVSLNQNVEASARFRGGIRKIAGSVDRFWTFSFSPLHNRVWKNMCKTCIDHEFKVNIEDLKLALAMMAKDLRWPYLSLSIIETMMMWALKRHLGNIRSFGEAFLRVTFYIQQSCAVGSCPNFFMPNINMLEPIDQTEVQRAGDELYDIISEVLQDDSAILTYVGYAKKKEGSSRGSRVGSAYSSKSSKY